MTKSPYTITEKDMFGTAPPVSDSVALASYPADSHDVMRIPVQIPGPNGTAQWTFAIEGGAMAHVPNPYPLSYRAMVPNAAQATNLLETISLSATHSAYRPIRMEPVYMMLGHAAGAAAALAVDDNTTVQNVDYRQLKSVLTAEGLVVDFPAIVNIADGGVAQNRPGRIVRLLGHFPGDGSEYFPNHSDLVWSSCCWPSAFNPLAHEKPPSACAPSTTALAGFSSSEIDLVVNYKSSSPTPFCSFKLVRMDPAVKVFAVQGTSSDELPAVRSTSFYSPLPAN
jgi:hypothetical protein